MILEGAFQPDYLARFDIPHPVRIPKAFASEPDKPFHIPWIEMSDEMQRSLDYEGKLDRSPENVETLIALGEECGRSFLAERARRVGPAGAAVLAPQVETGEPSDQGYLIRSVERLLPPRRCRALRGRRW